MPEIWKWEEEVVKIKRMQCTSANKDFLMYTRIWKQHGLEHYADGKPDENPLQPTYMLKQ